MLDNLLQGDGHIYACLKNHYPASLLYTLPPAQLGARSTEIPTPSSPGTLVCCCCYRAAASVLLLPARLYGDAKPTQPNLVRQAGCMKASSLFERG
jgi:hypothetical protein